MKVLKILMSSLMNYTSCLQIAMLLLFLLLGLVYPYVAAGDKLPKNAGEKFPLLGI